MRRTRAYLGFFVALAIGLGTTLTSAAPASAEVVENLVRRCGGSQVLRCVWINYDSSANRIRPWASIISRNHDVAVNRIRVQVSYFGRWVEADDLLNSNTYRTDYDGYHAPGGPNDDPRAVGVDEARGGLMTCQPVIVRTVAHFAWRGPVTREEDMASEPLDLNFFC